MDTVFTDRTSTNNAFNVSLLYQHREQLLTTLLRASERAAHMGHAALASITMPVPQEEPSHVFLAFEAMHIGERFFWEEPTGRKVLVGVGTATIIESAASAAITDTIEAWRELQRNTVSACLGESQESSEEQAPSPVLFGGFSFDPLRPQTALWHGFPAGLLLLPYLLYQQNSGQATLTFNMMIEPGTDVTQMVASITNDLQTLGRTLEQPVPGQEDTGTTQLATPHVQITTQDVLLAINWMGLVERVVDHIHAGDYKKVVLARAVQALSEERLSVDATLSRLRGRYPEAFKFVVQRGERYFIGATPERLLRAQDGQVQTMALAGTAPRGASAEEDRQLGMELLHSEKNRQEHEIVASMLKLALTDLCSELWVADVPELFQLHNLQHLKTPIIGELLPGRSILDAIATLHPTPAVGGFPRDAALTEIREHEQLDRGWYAGPIGWLDLDGNGEFAVALRSALVDNNRATLFAGCGIVADSLPTSEYAESRLKLSVMLRALSGEERE
jgi:menaquinone-specific isochorismate synthase